MLLLWCAFLVGVAHGSVVVQEPIAEGVVAGIQRGRVLYLDCRPPEGDAAKAFFARYLAEPERWTDYRGRLRVAIPFNRLNDKTRRAVLEAIFPADYVDEDGWWHTVLFNDERGVETLWSLSEWLTGLGTRHREILADEHNRGMGEDLTVGQRILVPARLLLPIMKVPSHRPAPAPAPERKPTTAPAEEHSGPKSKPGKASPPEEKSPPVKTPSEDEKSAPVPPGAPPLSYDADTGGTYAVYHMRKGEALFSSVVARFTSVRNKKDMLRACETIMRRSGIRDDRDIDVGARILIPIELLSDRYRPKSAEARKPHEAVRPPEEDVVKRDLEGIVIMLDPGHGGRDPGAMHSASKLYEDEICYDIVCRIKKILERDTGASVILTVEDPSQGYRTSERSTFTHDEDERLLTTPFYDNTNDSVSASLRWCLANAAYERLVKEGVDERKMLFASVHCDWLDRGKMRGAMVYVPGARYSVVKYPVLTKAVYRRYAESKNRKVETPSRATRQRNEALSRDFARTLLASIASHRPPLKIHRDNEPIRNVIHNGGKSYVPAVIRYNKVPTRVLVEAANLSNSTDRRRVADPKWRQWFAEAFVDAVKTYFAR